MGGRRANRIVLLSAFHEDMNADAEFALRFRESVWSALCIIHRAPSFALTSK